MKKYLLSLLLFFSLAFSNKSFAQLPSLGFSGPAFFPDSVVLDTVPYLVSMSIKNYSNNVPFPSLDTIKIITQVSVGGQVYSTDSSNMFAMTTALNPGSTYPFMYYEPYNSGRFAVGIDVVVIWPKALGATTHDSLEYIIKILSPSAVSELLSDDGISVYPNPCADVLTIENKHPQNPIERVSIFDIKGKLILSKSRKEQIDLSQIPAATYIIEFSYKSGMHKFMRVQKE